jgi:hypothetical protein
MMPLAPEAAARAALRRGVVHQGAWVCRRWDEAAAAVVRSPVESSKITFPYSLKQVKQERWGLWTECISCDVEDFEKDSIRSRMRFLSLHS